MSRYIGVVETAKLMRGALKGSFPGTKFSVRTSQYSGGASIHVGWTDGPTGREVDAVTGQFAGKRFDGMIDLEYGADHWLLPDGTIRLAGTYGHSFASENTLDRASAEPPVPGAELVHFGSGYVSTTRKLSKGLMLKVAAEVVSERGLDLDPISLIAEHADGDPYWGPVAQRINLDDTGSSRAQWLTDELYRFSSVTLGDGRMTGDPFYAR